MAMTLKRPDRVSIEVAPASGERRTRELSGFARYCIGRIERELGTWELWNVLVGISAGEHAAVVTVEHRGQTIEARTSNTDAALAIWDAMCRIEQSLREQRTVIAADRS